MISVGTENLITFEEAAAICGVTWKTIYCWSKRTTRALESVKLGGKRMTSREALQRFAEQGGDDSGAGVVIPTGPSGGTDYDDALMRAREHHGVY